MSRNELYRRLDEQNGEYDPLRYGESSASTDLVEVDRGWMKRQIEDAEKQMKKMKSCTPHIFQQYHDMNVAKRDLDIARERYRKAKATWDAL